MDNPFHTKGLRHGANDPRGLLERIEAQLAERIEEAVEMAALELLVELRKRHQRPAPASDSQADREEFQILSADLLGYLRRAPRGPGAGRGWRKRRAGPGAAGSGLSREAAARLLAAIRRASRGPRRLAPLGAAIPGRAAQADLRKLGRPETPRRRFVQLELREGPEVLAGTEGALPLFVLREQSLA